MYKYLVLTSALTLLSAACSTTGKEGALRRIAATGDLTSHNCLKAVSGELISVDFHPVTDQGGGPHTFATPASVTITGGQLATSSGVQVQLQNYFWSNTLGSSITPTVLKYAKAYLPPINLTLTNAPGSTEFSAPISVIPPILVAEPTLPNSPNYYYQTVTVSVTDSGTTRNLINTSDNSTTFQIQMAAVVGGNAACGN